MWISKRLEKQLNEDLKKARLEGARRTLQADLIRLLDLRFPGESFADLKLLIEQTGDLDVLVRWFDVVAIKLKIDAIRAALLADLPATGN